MTCQIPFSKFFVCLNLPELLSRLCNCERRLIYIYIPSGRCGCFRLNGSQKGLITFLQIPTSSYSESHSSSGLTRVVLLQIRESASAWTSPLWHLPSKGLPLLVLLALSPRFRWLLPCSDVLRAESRWCAASSVQHGF